MFMDYHITMESFGQDCPRNWDEIADYLNSQIDSLSDITDEFDELTPDGREQIDAIWNRYWNDYHSGTMPEGAPVPEND